VEHIALTKTDAIRDLLSQLPRDAAAKLLSAVDSGALPAKQLGLSAEEIRECLAPGRGTHVEKRDSEQTVMRLFCAPIEDFLFVGERTEKEAGRIPRDAMEIVWKWINDDLLPDAFPDMAARVSAHIDSGDMNALAASVRVMQEAAGNAMNAAFERGETDEKYFNSIARKLGEFSVLEDAREVADVFSILDEVIEMQSLIPRQSPAFDELMVVSARDLYNGLYEREPDRAIYLALALMGRLEAPWQILRLARKISQKKDDTMISRTDFSILGERLIKRLEVISSYFQRLRPGLSDLDELKKLIVEFSELSKGITKEIALLRIGNWGQRLLKARNIISTAIGDEFAHYAKDLAAALPLQRIGSYGRAGPRQADISHLPDEEKMSRCLRELNFMSEIQTFAQSIGAQNAFDKTLPELALYMENYEDAIVEELREPEPETIVNAEAFFARACEVTEILHDSDAAAVLKKRGRVALQASS
jgi:hypothetical protein